MLVLQSSYEINSHRKAKMSYYFTAKCIVQMVTLLPIPLFIALCIFINNILAFAYNSYHLMMKLQREKTKWLDYKSHYRNLNALDGATIMRRVTELFEMIDKRNDLTHKNVCLWSQLLNRILRTKPDWFKNHKMWNEMKELEFREREKNAFDKYINDPQRLINITYTFVNGYLSYDSLQSYRVAVCNLFCTHVH